MTVSPGLANVAGDAVDADDLGLPAKVVGWLVTDVDDGGGPVGSAPAVPTMVKVSAAALAKATSGPAALRSFDEKH
ncbi:hypothetical protein GS575_28720 [Rhodococcus hoagii]|nr:hypothetical protein [Prescottella equi]